jgi:16S rRNA (cytosine967-C5)-methyltransferase
MADTPSNDMLFAEPDAVQSRMVAVSLLAQCLDQQKPLDQILDIDQPLLKLDTRDRAFVRAIVITCLRRLGQVDDLIRRALERPDQKLQPANIVHVLRVGVVQLVFLDVPDHAAVHTAVELCDRLGVSRLKGLVNAVLRKIASEGKQWTSVQDIPRLNTPNWLLQSWVKDYGLQVAIQIASANMREPPLDLTLKDMSQMAHWGEQLQATVMPNGTLRRDNAGAIPSLPGFSSGQWWVQEMAASLAAPLLQVKPGETVLDLCAAPGGKTAQLAAMGANVVAVDRSASRMQMLKENMTRLGLSDHVLPMVADAAHWKAPRGEQFGKILLDAPCSATGTLRRQPDTGWLKTPEDVNRLAAVQARLLDNAAELLAPGGTLIYCTCSLQKAEGEAQISQFLYRHQGIIRSPILPEEIPGMPVGLNENRELRIMPWMLHDLGGLDGFFVARLKKLH